MVSWSTDGHPSKYYAISARPGCEDRLRNDLNCVGWGVKLYSIQSVHGRELNSRPVDYQSDALTTLICDILYCDIILWYIDFLTILFSFVLLVKLMRLSLVFIKGNLT